VIIKGNLSERRRHTQSEIRDLIDWVEKDFYPSVQGARSKERSKGEAKE